MTDNEFGYTAWGMDWVRLAEPLRTTHPEPLLPRARSIARNAGVHTEIEGTAVRASIHRGAQASVTYLELTPLSGRAITAIAALIPTDTVELGDAAHAAITASGITVAPQPRSTDCSCSARTPRCLHVLATYYALARRIDETPWLALDLQGYRAAAPPTGNDPATPPPRWTPLDTLDPATYFGTLT
ncbi:hypothetical protein KO481_31040 [Nocardia sp. NEAU-G5]|uniref:SWIM-type domain-containing protein n=1 Tax=Nocardia albiluteola TaxID=2842303 RepID=A0ABS6B6K2_9NOCA|nr:hypothetical protein [Nocardia albiluteola]MBU3065944.1 hypothetical protein [Nocardia albiluteola]